MARNIITALDIGTSTIQTVVAERGENGLRVLGIGIAPASGMRRGVVVDFDDAVSALRRSVDYAQKSAGVPVREVWLAVGGSHLGVLTSKGVVAVSRADGEISHEDVTRAIAAAETFVPKNHNREILHIIPRYFKVDAEGGVRDPVGMHGLRLEVDALIIECSSPALKSLLKCAETSGLAVADYVAAPLAAAEAVLTKRQKELGVVLLDVGGGTSSFIVFEEGVPIHAGVFPIGGNHVTNDVAIGLRTHVDTAEQVKVRHGHCLAEEATKKEVVRLADFVEGETASYPRRDLAEIVAARLGDIFELLQKELKKIGRSQLLPAGVVLVGGSSSLPGLVELTKRELKLPVDLGHPILVEEGDEHLRSTLAVSMGVLKWAEVRTEEEHRSLAGRLLRRPQASWLKWLKSFLP